MKSEILSVNIEPTTLEIHLQPIAAYLSDPSITEIVINEPGKLFIERRTGWKCIDSTEVSYAWCDSLARLLRNRASENLTEDWPMLGAQMPGGLRVQVVIPPATESGKISITIRRPGKDVLTLRQIAASGAFDKTSSLQSRLLHGDERREIEAALPDSEQRLLGLFRGQAWCEFFETAVCEYKNIVSSGKTGSGKTTLGNALASYIPSNERIITIEDTREMRLLHRNQVNLEYKKGVNGLSRLQPQDLLEGSLRMKPDRVLLAELRGSETFYFIQNVLNSGHPGTITTVHATSAKLAFQRLALMIKGSKEGSGLELADIKEVLYTLIDIVVQMKQLPDGRRIVTEVYYDPAFAARQLG